MTTENLQPHISRVNQKDLPYILELQKICYQTEAVFYNDYNIPPLTQDLDSLIRESETTIILKAVIRDEIIGSVRGHREDDICHIGRLIVNPAFQNQGIGSSLLRYIENLFSDCDRYVLFTGYKSEKNLYLYEKQGYSEFKREKINDKVTLVYLEKQSPGKFTKKQQSGFKRRSQE